MKQKIKVFSMFSGYGGAEFALKKAGIDFECVGYSEIDKYAIQCFEQNHYNYKIWGDKEKIKNYGDCTKINPDELPDFDLLTGGFPCQSFSVAGKGLGELDTRGTLFNDIIRIAEVKKPRYMLLENVKGLTFKPHKKTFEKILSELERIGYFVKWKVLNSKEHGIPQNRERVFFVCFRDYFEWKWFKFPGKEELTIFLKDILEHEVDEKYYLKQDRVEKLIQDDKLNKYLRKDVANCQTSTMWRGPGNAGVTIVDEEQPVFISSLQKHNSINNNGVSNALPSAMGMGGGHTPMILPVLTPDRLNKRQSGRRFKEDGDPMFTITSQDRHGILQVGVIPKSVLNDNERQRRLYSPDGVAPTVLSRSDSSKIIQLNNPRHSTNRIYGINGVARCLRGSAGGLGAKTGAYVVPNTQPFIRTNEYGQKAVNETIDKNDLNIGEVAALDIYNKSIKKEFTPTLTEPHHNSLRLFDGYRIRKLTPKECFRLMGFLDDEINLDGISNTQRYKLAGNGWDINLVSKILKNMIV